MSPNNRVKEGSSLFGSVECFLGAAVNSKMQVAVETDGVYRSLLLWCSQAASLQGCWLPARQSTAWFKVTVHFSLRGIFACLLCARASQVAPGVKNPPANARDVRDADSIPGSGRSPGEGHGNPLQYSCLKNPMDRGAWWAIIH